MNVLKKFCLHLVRIMYLLKIGHSMKRIKRLFNYMFSLIPRSKWGKQNFLLKIRGKKADILDIGCGNNSPSYIKGIVPDCYYVGVDVGDYHMSKSSMKLADEMYYFKPESFAEGIQSMDKEFDVVVSAHNIEHCNKPMETIDAICRRLRKGGLLYIAFPSSESVNFPRREGTLNFYDDPTHIYVPDIDEIVRRLRGNKMKIVKEIRGYKPVYPFIMGGVREPFSRRKGKVLKGTWGYWGFESVIWAEKV